jgi:TonB-linked SusC/RagA family outer membrane protein
MARVEVRVPLKFRSTVPLQGGRMISHVSRGLAALVFSLSVASMAAAQAVTQLGDHQVRTQADASLLDRSAHLRVTGVELRQALDALHASSGVRIAFSPSFVPSARVSCACEHVTVGVALSRMLAGTGFRHVVVGEQILIEPAPRAPTRSEPALANAGWRTDAAARPMVAVVGSPFGWGWQQTGTIVGRVVDASTQQPLASAQVHIAGLNLGTLSDQSGRFRIGNVPAGDHEVRAASIGYSEGRRLVSVTAGATATVNIQLHSSPIALQEIVVTGVAGATDRARVPFVVDRVRAEDMPVPSLSGVGTMIQGKVPGVQVVSASGMPGDEATILLRGPTSIMGSSDPLIIVDGIMLSSGTVDLDALDIESVEVVKGAAASSLYGSRAASGVIQITTHRGRGLGDGQTRFTARSEYGQSQLGRRISTAQYHPFQLNAAGTAFVDANGVEVDYASAILDGPTLDQTFQDKAYPMPTYDHLDRFFTRGASLTNYFAADGRSGGVNFHASFGSLREQGIIQGHDGFRRQNARLNLDYGLGTPLSIGLTSSFMRSHQDDIDMESRTSPMGRLSFMSPVADLLERDPVSGRIKVDPDPRGSALNPLYSVFYDERENERQRILAGASVRFAPLDWVDVEGNLSFDRTDRKRRSYRPKGYETSETGVSDGSLYISNYQIEGINSSLTAGINRSIGELSARIRARYLHEDEVYDFFSASGANFLVEDLPNLNVTSEGFSVSSSSQTVRSEGYFLISDFDFRGRYIASFLVRRDGSSLFGPDARWQTYYRASGAYRMAEESWWPLDAVNEFRLHYSVGTAGGRPNFAAQYETYTISGGSLQPLTLGNRALRPEFSTEHEAGLRVGILDRFTVEVTNARTRNENQLLQMPLRSYQGFSSQWRNAGTIESRTWEASVEAAIVERHDMSWFARLNLDRTRQEITHWPRSELRYGPFSSFYYREGEALGSFYGHRWATSCADIPLLPCNQSEFQVNDDGYLVWVGAGNSWQQGVSRGLWGTSGQVDGTAYQWGMPVRAHDETGNDVFILGNTQPDFSLGLTNSFRWRNLSVFTLLGAEIGADVYNMTRHWAVRDFRHGEVDQFGKSDERKKPLGYYNTIYDIRNINSHYVEDGSYLKLREVAVRYALGGDQIQRLFRGHLGPVDQIALSVTGRNLYTWTSYTGYDPEVGPSYTGTGIEPRASAWARFDNYQYPNFRTFRAMVEVRF